MTPEEIAALAAAERERARQDLHKIWKWCSGGHHEKQLQKEYRARRAKTKPNAERDRDFAAAVGALGMQAFIVMQAIDSGQELIHSFGQIIARAAQLGFVTWEDKLDAGVKTGSGKKGPDPIPDAERQEWRLKAADIWRGESNAKLEPTAKIIAEDLKANWRTVQDEIRDLNPHRKLSDR